MLYRSTDCRSRAGAAVENLAHSASFHSREKIAPSNHGIKQLGWLAAAADEVGEVGHARAVWDAEPGAEVVPERDAELVAGLAEAEEGIAAVARGLALDAAAPVARSTISFASWFGSRRR